MAVNRMNSESNEGLYKRFGMSRKGEEMNYGVVEVVIHRNLKCFGDLVRI